MYSSRHNQDWKWVPEHDADRSRQSQEIEWAEARCQIAKVDQEQGWATELEANQEQREIQLSRRH